MQNTSLNERLEAYPVLRRTLGERWIAEQDRVDPIISPCPIARWLRLDGFETDFATLDIVLGKLENVPGFGDRRRRIRADAPALQETLTELYFAAWLLDQEYEFNWPKQGADFLVHLCNDQTLAMEATTPRKAALSEDLFERLHLVALRAFHSVSIKHSLELLPDSALSTEFVATVVQQALDELAVIGQESRGLVQNYGEYGMHITWTPCANPEIRKTISSGPTTPYTGFYELVTAAQRKAKQLPEDRPGVLVFGTNQLPVSWGSFVDALRYHNPEETPFSWDLLPNQMKYIVLYSMELRRTEPFDAIWITNPASDLPNLPQAIRFFQNLFPFSVRSVQDSDSVSG